MTECSETLFPFEAHFSRQVVAKKEQQRTGQPARVFTAFFYQTRKTWSQSRRVVAKAEQIPGKENPRYVVTSLQPSAWPARELYE